MSGPKLKEDLQGNSVPLWLERRGFVKLKKRTVNKEIVISTTDKSAKNTVSSMESYLLQGEPHVRGDRVSSWKEFKKSNARTLMHTRAVTNILQPGKAHGENNEAWIWNAMMEEIT